MTEGNNSTVEHIESVILFGSQARGDTDHASDHDICVFTEDVAYSEVLRARGNVARDYGVPQDTVSTYPAPVVRRMARKGSLFLWHLRLEGRIIVDHRRFAQAVFDSLAPFASFEQELDIFARLLNHVKDTFECERQLSEADLHFLQSMIRSTCILLCYWDGRPTFGRLTPFTEALRRWPALPVDPPLYERLCRWHLQYTRGVLCSLDVPSTGEAQRIVDTAERTIAFARGIIK